jgi:hypothetical protein
MQSNPVIHPPTAVKLPLSPGSSGSATSDGTYKPSVPMWVYRQLSQELNSTQTKLSEVEQEKERLFKQNQILVKELSAIAKSNHQLQEILNKSAKSLRNTMAQTLAAKSDRSMTEAQELAASLRLGIDPKATNGFNGHHSHNGHNGHANQPLDPVDQQVQEAMAKAQAMIAEPPQPEAPELESMAPEPGDMPELKAEIPQPETPVRRSSRPANANSEFKLSGLAMAAIVVAIVATSFGAGYLIVKPLADR